MQPRVRIAILASGNGTNAEAIMRHFQHHADVRVALVLSNNPNAYVLERAKKFSVQTYAFTREQFKGSEVVQILSAAGITHIVLAGFLWLVPAVILNKYTGQIINIHPALLPLHGGKGMYGKHVHESVKAAGDSRTGITIHLVNEEYDEGQIIFQAECAVTGEDTPQTIAEKVHALEYKHYPTVIEQWALKSKTS